MVDAAIVSKAFLVLSGVVSLVLVTLATLAYRRTRATALSFVAGAFTLFAAKSFFVAYSLQSDVVAHELLELMDAIGDLGTVLLLVAPIFWPPRSP